MKPRAYWLASLSAILCATVAIAALGNWSQLPNADSAGTPDSALNSKSGKSTSGEPTVTARHPVQKSGTASLTGSVSRSDTVWPAASFSQLLRAAESGDAAASLSVAKLIWNCLDVPKSRVDYDMSLAAAPTADQPAQANYNVEVEQIDECAETPRDKELAAKHFKIAADHGDLDAAYEYATILPSLSGVGESESAMAITPEIEKRFRELDAESVEYLLKAANQGHLPSAVALAAKYQFGFEVHPNGTRRFLREPDLLNAYAWYYAAETAKGGLGPKAWKKSIEPKLAEMGLLADARALGQELYREHLQ